MNPSVGAYGVQCPIPGYYGCVLWLCILGVPNGQIGDYVEYECILILCIVAVVPFGQVSDI